MSVVEILELEKYEAKALKDIINSIPFTSINKEIKKQKKKKNKLSFPASTPRRMYPCDFWSHKLLFCLVSSLLLFADVEYAIPQYIKTSVVILLKYQLTLNNCIGKKRKKIKFDTRDELYNFMGQLLTKAQIQTLEKFIFSFKLNESVCITNAVLCTVGYIQRMQKLQTKYSKKKQRSKQIKPSNNGHSLESDEISENESEPMMSESDMDANNASEVMSDSQMGFGIGFKRNRNWKNTNSHQNKSDSENTETYEIVINEYLNLGCEAKDIEETMGQLIENGTINEEMSASIMFERIYSHMFK